MVRCPVRPSGVSRPQLQADPVHSGVVAARPCCLGCCRRPVGDVLGLLRGCRSGSVARCCRVLDVRLWDCGPVLCPCAWVGRAVSELGSLCCLLQLLGGPWASLYSSRFP